MTRRDLIWTLSDILNSFVASYDGATNLSLMRGDLLVDLPRILDTEIGDSVFVAVRPFGFECESNLERLRYRLDAFKSFDVSHIYVITRVTDFSDTWKIEPYE